MNELPEGWTLTPVDVLFEVNPPKPSSGALAPDAPVSFVPMAAVDAASGTIAQVERRPFSSVRNGYTAFRDGDVILAKITPCFENGKAAIAEELTNGLGFGSSEFHVLRPTGVVAAEYLFHFIRQQRFRDEAAGHMTGTAGQARVPADYMKTFELPVPPLQEQKRIVAKLEDLLAKVAAARERLDAVPAILKRFRQSVLAAACSGRLTFEWREARYPESATADVESLPGTWKALSIAEVASKEPRSIQSGPFGSNLRHSEFTDTGILVIGIDNVNDGSFSMGREHRISLAKFQELQKYAARPLDILVTVMATVGRCCVVPPDLEDAIITKHVYRITADRSIIDPYFLLCVLRGDPSVQTQIAAQIRGQTRPGINGQILKSLVIPVPPLDEQVEIARRVNLLLELAGDVQQQVDSAANRARWLTQSILAKAFRGELVLTEAELAAKNGREYEPAALLLERIRTERMAAGQADRRRRRPRDLPTGTW